jgi:uncharacterized protein YceK
MNKLLLALAVVALTAACSEKPQSAGGVKGDTAPYTGTGKAYAETNWKQGDKTSWESALKVRAQNGQNDYTKVQ